ncbi:hypothetical protein ONZ45_g13753 [Pleurotus djamor]|nr:hypothetical protein ONZ45_g13753 [Pleurotus djamor]
MQHPDKEIEQVVSTLTTTSSAKVQQDAVVRYFTHDAGFRHPLCAVAPAPGSRAKLLGIYQWYRFFSPTIELEVQSIIYDKEAGVLILEIEQVFHIWYSPFKPAPAKLTTRVKLREENGLHYIYMQEDFYHPEDLMSLLVPPLVPIIHMFLLLAGASCGLFASIARKFGFWDPAQAEPVGTDGAESEAALKWD